MDLSTVDMGAQTNIALSRAMQNADLGGNFTSDYRIERSSYAEALISKDVFHLRYRVYCIDRQFLNAAHYVDQCEVDEYDIRSTYFSAYAADNALLGSVRIVIGNDAETLPFEKYCPVFPNFTFTSRDQSCEISRLVIQPHLCRRANDELRPQEMIVGCEPTTYRSGNQRLLLSLYRALTQHCRDRGIVYLYAAMETRLARSLKMAGFNFKAIGPESDYYGPVAPFVIDLQELDVELRTNNPVLARWFIEERAL